MPRRSLVERQALARFKSALAARGPAHVTLRDPCRAEAVEAVNTNAQLYAICAILLRHCRPTPARIPWPARTNRHSRSGLRSQLAPRFSFQWRSCSFRNMADVGCHQRPMGMVLSIGRHKGHGHLRNRLGFASLEDTPFQSRSRHFSDQQVLKHCANAGDRFL
jgi:hypothetical protein